MNRKMPRIKVDSVRKIFDDGKHNAFTDMCEFNGMMYLAFRSSPSGHDIKNDSEVIILSSRNGKEWNKVYSFNAPLRDLRDPHFLIFKGKLFVYVGSWDCNPALQRKHSLRDHLGYAVFTEDGHSWSKAQALESTQGYFIWRAATFGGKAYMCGRRVEKDATSASPEIRQSVLLESDCGFSWKPAGIFQEEGGNETAFLFEDDGSIVAVARYTNEASQLCRAKAPYKDWNRTELPRFIGGPLFVKWGRNYLLGSRKLTPETPRTVLSWLVNDKLIDMLELPSGGDNSYPGFIALNDKNALISYYSSHEGSNSKLPPCSIYLAEISID